MCFKSTDLNIEFIIPSANHPARTKYFIYQPCISFVDLGTPGKKKTIDYCDNIILFTII